METKEIYYVAVAFEGGIFNPQIVEQFNTKEDANSYAALMSRTKQRNYIVLHQICEWDSEGE